MLGGNSRLAKIEGDIAALRNRVQYLETLQSEKEIQVDVWRSDLARLSDAVARLPSSPADSRTPTPTVNIDGEMSRFQSEVEELRRCDQVLGLASVISNPDLASFLRRGKIETAFQFARSLSGEGVIGFLRRQSSQFEPRCILSQSSRDLYSIIDPESRDSYASSDSGSAWVLVEFREPVEICEIEIRSGSKYFPRSFDFVCTGTDGKVVRTQVRDANLNCADKRERFEIRRVVAQSVKIEQKGANWKGSQYLCFKSLEFFAPSGKFRSGVFGSLLKDHRDDVSRFVCLTARDFDMSDVHSVTSRKSVCTWGGGSYWVEIDLLDHRLLMTSYRLKRGRQSTLKTWSILGSNDRTLALEEWTKVDSRSESVEGEFELLHVFECFGCPFRYYRIVNEGPRWDENPKLTFLHIDFFGLLFPVHSP
jgi:hypothetical protein